MSSALVHDAHNMKPYHILLTAIAASSTLSLVVIAAYAPPAKPIPAITPGKVIIPIEKMHRIWGELISIDFAARTGKFRNESTDEVMMPPQVSSPQRGQRAT